MVLRGREKEQTQREMDIKWNTLKWLMTTKQQKKYDKSIKKKTETWKVLIKEYTNKERSAEIITCGMNEKVANKQKFYKKVMEMAKEIKVRVRKILRRQLE